MDVYDQLWENNKDIAEQTLALPFFQHMKIGDLQADNYVMFMIQDITYLLQVTDMLKMMIDKATTEDLQNFFVGRYESYKSYADGTLKTFKLKEVKVIASQAMENYLKSYRDIMNTKDPIYFAVALLPCSRLWLWLANHMQQVGYGNAYFTWKKDNMYGHPEKHYRQLLNDNLKTTDQIKMANDIFRKHMQHEHNFFASSLDA